jgi:hypothetical protein
VMPSRRTRLKCGPLFTLLAVVFLLPTAAEAQTGRVALQGHVSETVSLSVVPNFTHGNPGAEVTSTGNTVRITLTTDNKSPVVRVPLLVRSNSSFKLSADFASATNLLTQLLITDVRPTGRLVSPAAVSGLNISKRLDLNDSRESLLVSGPRVSLGGTLDSPTNALQITVLIRLDPQAMPGQQFQLTFAAAPLAQ